MVDTHEHGGQARPLNSAGVLAAVPCRLRAPEGDRAVLVEPPPERVAELVAGNRHIRDQVDYDLQGRPLREISAMARAELLGAARRWTAAYRNVPARPDAGGLIFLAGHQPQMFHPGVWLKNFALGALSRKHGAAAVNLIIDADATSETALAVPTGTAEDPRTVRVPFDRPDPKIPYEERAIEDRELFNSFGRRVVQELGPLLRGPIIERYWPLVAERARETGNLGACLAQARHQLEGQFWASFVVPASAGRRAAGRGPKQPAEAGTTNSGQPAEAGTTNEAGETLEVPQSWLCKGEAFQWFAAHLLARLPRFRRIYNEALGEYRRLHHLRSRSHPAPELAEDGEWQEAPFWVWTAELPRRRRLLARAAAGEIVLSDREGWQARLPLSEEADAGRAVERLMELGRRGVRIRPRALMTTLWARLALGDLMIHGIGGAKYDWVTDRLMERFFGLRPPGFLVLSATLHLPIGRLVGGDSCVVGGDSGRRLSGATASATGVASYSDSGTTAAAEVRAIEDELRGMTYHPERYLTQLETVPRSLDDLIAAKRGWIKTPQTPNNARERCHAIRAINAALQPRLEDRRERLTRWRAAALRKLRAGRVLGWREYAFCLHPEPALREFLSALLPKIV